MPAAEQRHPDQVGAQRYAVADMALRVVVAEDSMLVREGIVSVLAADPDITVVSEASDLDSLLGAVDEHAPDVVVTDIRMPPSGTDEGIRAATRIREQHPEVGVVVLSQFAEPGYALELLDTGTEGRAYLLKERVSDRGQLADAIRVVSTGGSVIDPKVVEVLLEGRSRARTSPLRYLTPRETEVLAEIAQGKNNAGVARSLVLSERAVAKHINSLFSKLNLDEEPDAHRRVAAVLLYLSDGEPER